MPARLCDVARAVRAMGGSCEEPSSGSHWKLRMGSVMFTIPAHNGLRAEISDRYIRAMCRNLGISEAALRAKL